MAVRPGLDEDPEIEDLIAVWRRGSDEIQSQINDLRSFIFSEPNPYRRTRLRLAISSLEQKQEVIDAIVDDLVQATQNWIETEGMERVYAHGANRTVELLGLGSFAFSVPHQEAVKVIAADTFRDVLAATRYVNADTKRFVRNLGKRITEFKLTTGDTAVTASRKLERRLLPVFNRGIGRVRYRDGSRHSVGEYAEMLLRTKTAIAYNAGTVNLARTVGVEFFEILDSDDCGLTAHHDPVRANGLIVDARTAYDFPISHPNCVRALNARPDLNRSTVEPVEASPRGDVAAFEQAFLSQARTTSSGRTTKTPKTAKTPKRRTAKTPK